MIPGKQYGPHDLLAIARRRKWIILLPALTMQGRRWEGSGPAGRQAGLNAVSPPVATACSSDPSGLMSIKRNVGEGRTYAIHWPSGDQARLPWMALPVRMRGLAPSAPATVTFTGLPSAPCPT